MFLLLVLIRNPIAFIRAVTLDFTFGHPVWAYGRYSYRSRGLQQEAISYVLFPDDVNRKGLVDPAAWYAAAHNIARFELYRASRDYALKGNTGKYVWRKVFGPVTPGTHELHVIAAVASKTTGRIVLRALGISASQERIESALVFPRYLRCVLGLVTDALQGGVRGNEGRRLLAQVALAGAAIYLLLTVL